MRLLRPPVGGLAMTDKQLGASQGHRRRRDFVYPDRAKRTKKR